MKESLRQLQEKYGQPRSSPEVAVYAQTLQNLVEVSGDGKSYRDDPRPLAIRLKANEVYAVRCQDDDRYWKSVMLKKNDLSGKFQVFISNAIYGDPGPGIQEISQEQVFKQMRQMNAGMVTGTDLKAFPHTGAMQDPQGAPGQGLVSQHHRNLLGGKGQ